MNRQSIVASLRRKQKARKKRAAISSSSQGAYSHKTYKHRSKTLWAGINIGLAFNFNQDYYTRLAAQQLFYRLLKKTQHLTSRLAGRDDLGEFKPKIKPQLSPCYTQYPPIPAAHAAIGLTAYLEYSSRANERVLFLHLKEYLQQPAQRDRVNADPDIYQKLAHVAADCVQIRLLYEDLSRNHSLVQVELYRLFSASQMGLGFGSLPEIIKCVVLFGDVLPGWQSLGLHPFTRKILWDLSAVCSYYQTAVRTKAGADLIETGCQWVRSLCKALSRYLPEEEEPLSEMPGQSPSKMSKMGIAFRNLAEQNRFSKQSPQQKPDRLSPLNGPNPPSLFESSDTLGQMAGKIVRENDPNTRSGPARAKPMVESTQRTLQEFASAVEKAGGQQRSYEDMRSDRVEKAMAKNPFKISPIEGNPSEGHEVDLNLGGKKAGGEIFDRPVALSDDLPAYEALLSEADAFIQALRQNLYPNFRQVPKVLKLRTVGTLDPARICLFEFSSTVFKRHQIREAVDLRGRPLLVMACDGSGSLSEKQMRMVKLLAAGWLNATAKTGVEVLSGLYHSGSVRMGVSGPLVQWIYHPRKTPTMGRKDASRALVSLPNKGTGMQSDALSLGFILSEAKKLARGNMVYLILISDTAWNQSFHGKMTGQEEVYAFFENAYEEFKGKLHTTLVALGVSAETGFEDLLDKVIRVSSQELDAHEAVAEKIGLYVASCMKENQRLKAGRSR